MIKKSKQKINIKSSLIIFTAAVFVFSTGTTYAIDNEQKKLYNQGINYFDYKQDCSQLDSGDDVSVSGITPGNGTPTGLTYPNLRAEDMVMAIINYIRAHRPDSVFINASDGGAKAKISAMVASSKNSNINPFAIVALLEKETSFGNPGDYNIRHGNNAFGRKATSSQPHFMGSGPNAGTKWYKWNSIKESVDYTDPDNKRIAGGGDQVTYFRIEYGESIDRNSIEDSIMRYAPDSENDTAGYIQSVKNTLQELADGIVNTSASGESEFYENNDEATINSTGCACGSSDNGTSYADAYSSASLPESIPAYWRNLIQNAAPKHPTSDPRVVATVLWVENRGWPDPNKNWAVSSAGAKGPFQFIDITWEDMGYDGDGDGVKDPNNPEDAVHAAFIHNEGSTGKPIVEGFTGNADSYYNQALFKRDGRNLLYFAAKYNGRGAPDNTLLKNFPRGENSDYVRMSYWLLASNFQKAWSPATDSFIDPNSNASPAANSGGPNGNCGTTSGSDGSGVLVGDLAWPVPKKFVDQNFSWFTKGHHDHPSSDIPVPDQTEIYSITSGKVTFVSQNGYNGGYGTVIAIETNGALFRYQHGTPGTITVKKGDQVRAGQLIMKSGYTGLTVPRGPGGTHLHVSIETGGNNILQRTKEHCPQDLFKAMKSGSNISDFKTLPTSGCVSGSIY